MYIIYLEVFLRLEYLYILYIIVHNVYIMYRMSAEFIECTPECTKCMQKFPGCRQNYPEYTMYIMYAYIIYIESRVVIFYVIYLCT